MLKRNRGFNLLGAGLVCACMLPAAASRAANPNLITDLENPESVAVHPDGRVFISVIGASGVDGDGRIVVVTPAGERRALATGLDDPKGLDLDDGVLYVTDKNKVVAVTLDGDTRVYTAAEDFPRPPVFLNDLEIDAAGNVYVSDSGDADGSGGAVYRIRPDGEVGAVLPADPDDPVLRPNGLLMDGAGHLLVADFGSGALFRLALASGEVRQVNQGFGAADGLARDSDGTLYISDWKGGRVFALEEPGGSPRLLADDFQTAADIALGANGGSLLVPDMKAGVVRRLPLQP